MKNQSVDYLTTLLNTANSHLSSIAYSIEGLRSHAWEIAGAIASFTVALVALYAANKDEINSRFFKPKIQIIDKPFTLQQNNLYISRLKIQNSKKWIAKNVTFWFDALWYYEDNAWRSELNFLSFPLNWTHVDIAYIDLLYARPYYLDLCQVIDGSSPEIHVCAVKGSPKMYGLNSLRNGKNKLRITLYCENHPIEHYYLEIEWDGTFTEPEIKIDR